MSESNPDPPVSKQEQARLRRERRNAKIQAGGSARLQAITQLSGRSAPVPTSPEDGAESRTPDPSQTTLGGASREHESTRPVPGQVPGQVHDPEEIDISRPFPDSFLQAAPSASDAFRGQVQPDDPLPQMLQQMLGGAGFGSKQTDANLPPGIADFLSGMQGEQQGQQGRQQQQASSRSAYVWRILHAIFSFSLAIYIAVFATAFDGTKSQRISSGSPSHVTESPAVGSRFWTIFATAELCLQASRYFIERGQLQSSGFAGGLARVLPEPWAGYLRIVSRYGVIYSTVVADAMVIVFTLGCVSWWRGRVETVS